MASSVKEVQRKLDMSLEALCHEGKQHASSRKTTKKAETLSAPEAHAKGNGKRIKEAVSGKGASSKGASSKGVSSKGASSKGASSKGASGKGASGKGVSAAGAVGAKGRSRKAKSLAVRGTKRRKGEQSGITPKGGSKGGNDGADEWKTKKAVGNGKGARAKAVIVKPLEKNGKKRSRGEVAWAKGGKEDRKGNKKAKWEGGEVGGSKWEKKVTAGGKVGGLWGWKKEPSRLGSVGEGRRRLWQGIPLRRLGQARTKTQQAPLLSESEQRRKRLGEFQNRPTPLGLRGWWRRQLLVAGALSPQKGSPNRAPPMGGRQQALRGWGGQDTAGAAEKARPEFPKPHARGRHDDGPRRMLGPVPAMDAQPRSVKVTNVPLDLESRDIKEAFEGEAGKVLHCELSRGVAILRFLSAEDAKRAVKTFDRGELNGRTIHVQLER